MSVCCHKCGGRQFPHQKHSCVSWFIRVRIFLGRIVKKLSKRISGDYWQCTDCGFVDLHEREVICWCCGTGEMIYQG